MRYFMHLSYDGTRYHGWQKQPDGISVEGEIERCLAILLRQEIDIVGAGRTDAGVHARHMVAHFDAELPDFSTENGTKTTLQYRLNRLLPADIHIYKVEHVADEMHARFSATARTYHYYVSTQPNPFARRYTWQTHYALNFEAMNQAAALLTHYDDFACFCKSHTDVKTTLCDVMEARWIPVSRQLTSNAMPMTFTADDAPTEWYFRIKANRFLRNMVRAVVGTLVEVGRGRMSIDEFRHVIEGKKRTQAGESMPANALFLERIDYPETGLPTSDR